MSKQKQSNAGPDPHQKVAVFLFFNPFYFLVISCHSIQPCHINDDNYVCVCMHVYVCVGVNVWVGGVFVKFVLVCVEFYSHPCLLSILILIYYAVF